VYDHGWVYYPHFLFAMCATQERTSYAHLHLLTLWL
jgi:hypothetical protein